MKLTYKIVPLAPLTKTHVKKENDKIILINKEICLFLSSIKYKKKGVIKAMYCTCPNVNEKVPVTLTMSLAIVKIYPVPVCLLIKCSGGK